MLEMTTNALTNLGKHVTSNVAFMQANDTPCIQSSDWPKLHCA